MNDKKIKDIYLIDRRWGFEIIHFDISSDLLIYAVFVNQWITGYIFFLLLSWCRRLLLYPIKEYLAYLRQTFQKTTWIDYILSTQINSMFIWRISKYQSQTLNFNKKIKLVLKFKCKKLLKYPEIIILRFSSWS